MAVDFFDPLGSFLRAGGGLLWLGIAILVLAIGPKTSRTRALAAAIGGGQVGTAAVNAAFVWQGLAWPAFLIDIAGYVVATAGLGWLFWNGSMALPRGRRASVWALALATFAGFAVRFVVYSVRLRATNWILGPFPASYQWIGLVDTAAALLYWPLVVGWVAATLETTRDEVNRPRAEGALTMVGFAFVLGGDALGFDLQSWASYVGSADWGARMQGPLGLLGDSTALVMILWLLRLAGRPGWRLGRVLMFGSLAIACGGAAIPLGLHGAFGLFGIALVLGALLFLFGVFYRDSLGVHLRPTLVRRGTIASLGLAALFITAQVAQNFLGARLGVAWGGIVAGAVVFAAFPLQKAAERAMERKHHGIGAGPSAIYRKQVETAWRDGRLGANERIMLRELRLQLGISTDDADLIDHEVAGLHVKRSVGGAK